MTPEDKLGQRLASLFTSKADTPSGNLLPLVLQVTRTQRQDVAPVLAVRPLALAIPMLGAAAAIVIAILWLQSLRSPGVGSEVMQEVVDQGYTLSLHLARDHFQVGEAIDAYALLTYSGPAGSSGAGASSGSATIIPWGSSSGIVGFSVSKEGGPSAGPGFREDCGPAAALVHGTPTRFPFQKSGGYSAEDPNLDFYRDFFATPELRLPAGVWKIGAETHFKPTRCEGPTIILRAVVSVVVTP